MNAPFTPASGDAFMIAESSLAAVLTAVVWRGPLGGRLGSALFLFAVWAVALLPIELSLANDFGRPPDPQRALHVMQAASALVVVATALARPRWTALFGVFVALALYAFDRAAVDFGDELQTVHLFAFAAVYGFARRFADSSPPPLATPRSLARPAQDWLLFAVATVLGAVVCVVVLEKFVNSGDEWANTYQADLFAHFKAYAVAPPCPNLFRNYWVFFYMGRAFAQYTPGWPLVMAPFARLGVVWLASPVVFGALVVGVARIARRIAACDPRASDRQVSAAGVIAALSVMAGASMLLNAGSRYPHILVAACFAWAVESLSAMTDGTADAKRRARLGLVLGTACAFGLATRPGDGAMFGVGIFFAFVYAFARGRIGLAALATTAASFAAWAVLCLVILHAQLGEWFKTGYSIAGEYFAWATPRFSVPKASDLHFALPLASGAYCWWPAAPALGVAGLVQARGRSSMAAFTLAAGVLAMLTFYTLSELGRVPYNPGYGPRFILPTVVAMAVGGGVLLAPLWRAARSRWAGPAVLAVVALASGTLRIAPLLYAEAHKEVHLRGATFRAIRDARLTHAVVTANGSDVSYDPMDMAQNLPTDSDPDVYIFVDGGFSGPEDMRCGRRHWGDRAWYRAVGKEDPVKLVPR